MKLFCLRITNDDIHDFRIVAIGNELKVTAFGSELKVANPKRQRTLESQINFLFRVKSIGAMFSV